MFARRLAIALLGAALALLPTGAAAEGAGAPAISAPTASLITLSGTLDYEQSLETPHFAVGGWALLFDDPAVLKRLVGKQVTAVGTRFTGMSILMRRQLEVLELHVTLEGDLREVTDLESPHMELDGWVLLGEPEQLASLAAQAGSRVRISGLVEPGPTLFMKPALSVQKIESLRDELPVLVVVKGPSRIWVEPPVIIDDWLMLPLRPVIETAGGAVYWDPVQRAVRVDLGDRSVTVAIGRTEVAGGLQLPLAPVIRNNQTMVPVELFLNLGLGPSRLSGVLVLEPMATATASQ